MTIHTRPKQPPAHEISPAVQEELVKHPGKWVALTRTAVIEIRDTSTEAYEAAIAAGVESPILYQVPDPRAGYA